MKLLLIPLVSIALGLSSMTMANESYSSDQEAVAKQVEQQKKFKHDHRHKDGSADVLTMYGGVTLAGGSETSQDFPVDAETKQLFTEQGLDVSLTNVWTFSIEPDQSISYALTRPNRQFRIAFDMNKPVSNPPKAWGAK